MILDISLYLLGLVVVAYIFLWAIRANFSLYINPIKGIMIGALYDAEEYEDDEVTQHTIQILIFFMSFMFLWETTLTNTDE